MAEPGVHEIQLSAKQLVFMFMAAVVVAVGIFLLGVSVGRGVREATGGGATEVRVGTPPTTPALPPATKTNPADLTYHDSLQAPRPGETAKPQEPPASQPSTPPPAAVTPPPAASAPPPAPATTTTKDTGTKAAPPPQQSPATAPAGKGWVVQVGTFRDRANAEKTLQELKGQGFPASIVVSGGTSRVRVGPYAQKTEADAVAKKLAKYKPVVTR
jgi:DedD protein